MKYVTFKNTSGQHRAGWLENGKAYDMNLLSKGKLPNNMLEFLKKHESYSPMINQIREYIKDKTTHADIEGCFELSDVTLLAPIPNPPSIRDFYAFEEHVRTARENKGLSVPKEWYEIPVFYFTNHHATIGPNEKVAFPKKSELCDYELEIACIIGREGRNIQANNADNYIFGYCILNDWSARDLQREEMKMGLGPAKGKDFATSIGPYLVTKDELENYRSRDRYDLNMTAKVNGKQLSQGNFNSIFYTFGQMIERASESATLYPGDIIGSGTIGTGCILELGTEVHPWLKSGDVVTCEITGLGILENVVK